MRPLADSDLAGWLPQGDHVVIYTEDAECYVLSFKDIQAMARHINKRKDYCLGCGTSLDYLRQFD